MIMQVGNAVITRKPGTINGRKNMTKGNFYTEQSLCFRLLSIWLLVLSQLSRKQEWLGWCRWSHRNMAQVSRKNNTICITGNSQETLQAKIWIASTPSTPPPPQPSLNILREIMSCLSKKLWDVLFGYCPFEACTSISTILSLASCCTPPPPQMTPDNSCRL